MEGAFVLRKRKGNINIMKTININESIKRGWELFKAHKKLLVLASLIFMIAGSFQNIHSHSHGYEHFGYGFFGGLISLALYAVYIIVQMGWTKMLLKIEDGQETSLNELFHNTDKFWKFLITQVMYMVITMVGFVLLVIPGFYFLLKYMFAPIIMMDKEIGIKEAFAESKAMTEGIKWKLLGFIIVFGFINVLGAIVFIVGLLVSIPVSMLAFVHIYRTLSNNMSPVVTTDNNPTIVEPVILK